MPGDLFDTVGVSPGSVQTRRSPIFVLSLAVHVVILVAVLIGSAVAPGVLPSPREVLAFYEPIRVDIKLPPPPPAPRPASTTPPGAPAVSANAAPVVPPATVEPESPIQHQITRDAGLIDGGVIDGIGSSVDGQHDAATPPFAPPPPMPPRRLSIGITAPIKTVNVAPRYPEAARIARIEGVVIIEAVIDASGAVTSARVLRGIAMLDQAAVDAVSQWKFTPARLNDEAIPVVMTVTVNFQLK